MLCSHRGRLLAGALLVALLALFAPGGCFAEAPQTQQQHKAPKVDITVEEAILRTYEPTTAKAPTAKAPQTQQPQPQQRAPQVHAPKPLQYAPQVRAPHQGDSGGSDQQHAPADVGAGSDGGDSTVTEAVARRQRELQERAVAQQDRQEQQRAQQAAQDADKARLRRQREQLERAQQAAAQERAAKEGQEAALGRQSLRQRRHPPAKQAPVTGSSKKDVFAQEAEKALAGVRARMAQLIQQQQAAAAAAAAARTRSKHQQAGKAGGTAGGKAQAKPQQQHAAPQKADHAQQQQQHHQGAGAGGTSGSHRRRHRIPLPIIIIMTLIMAAAAGLGALPFFFMRSMSARATGLATAVACGVMLAASFDLIHEGQPYGAALTVLGVLLGGGFIAWVHQHLEAYEDIQFGDLQGSSARKTVLMVGIMAAHALGEGCAVGVSFCGERGWAQGVLTTLAIGVHNIPEGLAKATVLVGQGVSPQRALAWSIATCLPQPLVAVPSFMFVDAFMMVLPLALGFAAGCMIWLVFAELLPDAVESAQAAQVATAATAAAAGLEGFRMLFASMEQADGTLGCSAALARAFARAGPPLGVLLPAVAAAAAGGGGLGGSAVPAPVAWGLAAAVAASSGGGTLLDQWVRRPEVPVLHTAAAAAVGAALAVLLHRHLLNWAYSAAAAAARLGKNGGGYGTYGGYGGGSTASMAPARSMADVEAMEQQAALQVQLQVQLQRHAQQEASAAAAAAAVAQGLPPPPPPPSDAVAGVYVDGPAGLTGSNNMNGFGGSSSALMYQAPYHRAAAAAGAAAKPGLPGSPSSAFARPASALSSSTGTPGGVTPQRRRPSAAALLPAPQAAAVGVAVAALGAGAVTAGWRLGCSLLLLGTDRTAAILPAAALLVVPGLGAGALARTLPTRRGSTVGAWLGGLLGALAAGAAVLTAARAPESAHSASLVRSYLYPLGAVDTAEAVAAGALCAAAHMCLSLGTAVKAGSARGGLVLGVVGAALLAGLRMALCSATPYCLSVHALLHQAR